MHILYVQGRYFDLALMFSEVHLDHPRASGLQIFEETLAFHWTASSEASEVSSTFKVYVLPPCFFVCYPAKKCLGHLRGIGSVGCSTVGALFHHYNYKRMRLDRGRMAQPHSL